MTLGLVLAAYEAATSTDSWRRVDPGTRLYLRFLADHGCTLTGVDLLGCGDEVTAVDDGGGHLDAG